METLLQFVVDHQERILTQTGEHLELSIAAVLIAVAIGLPLGMGCTWNRWLGAVILNLVSIIYTIPSLALFGIMIPLIGIGWFPALVALVLYSLLPIVQNTYTGIRSVPAHIVNAAHGMGMSWAQILLRVQIPLALPVLSAGVRVAMVNAIGLVTIASFIGAGGLGDLIFRGISSVSGMLVLVGSVPVVAFAIGGDLLLRALEARLHYRSPAVEQG